MAVWKRYAEKLAPVAATGRIGISAPPARVEHNAHIFFVRVSGLPERSALTRALNAQGIGATFHYPALHTTPQGARIHDGAVLPNACVLSDSLVRLPVTCEMTDDDVDRVCDAVTSFLGG
jgi:dTDP-4-amino-4,6-dideoxygalactose transaminase